MTDEELERTIRAVDALTDELSTSHEKAMKFFIDEGFLTPTGELAPEYRQGA